MLRAFGRPHREELVIVVLETAAATQCDEPEISDLGEDHPSAHRASALAVGWGSSKGLSGANGGDEEVHPSRSSLRHVSNYIGIDIFAERWAGPLRFLTGASSLSGALDASVDRQEDTCISSRRG